MDMHLGTEAAEATIDVASDALMARAQAVAAVAASHAESVDREARFPAEAIAEAKAQRLFGAMVPMPLGGEGASLGEIMDVCYTLGQACASTAMIYAMHQIKTACIIRHMRGSVALERLLRRLCEKQLLLASSTTEGQGGGNVRASEAPVERQGARISLERRATVISYGANADGIVTTARRSADAAASDQVLVAFLKSDYTLEPLQGWNTLGMRGTCSEGYILRATGDSDQILPDPYEKIHAHTMVPFAHMTWGAVWAGIAATATGRAQAFVRHAARQANGQLPPGAAHFTKALSSLRMLRGLLSSSRRGYELAMADERALSSFEFQSMITLTKVETSELALATVMSAMRACGLAGYRSDGDFSLGRQLRDILSSPIMINNDRILSSAGAQSLMTAIPSSLQD